MTRYKHDVDELQSIIEDMCEDKRLQGKLPIVQKRLEKIAKSRTKAAEWADVELPELPEFVNGYDEEVPVKAALKFKTVIHDDNSDDDEPKAKAKGASSSAGASATFKPAPKVSKAAVAAASDAAAGVPASFKRASGKAVAAPPPVQEGLLDAQGYDQLGL